MSGRVRFASMSGLVMVLGSALAVIGRDYHIPIPIEICLDNDDCALDEYCLKPMGACDGIGECVDRLPEIVQCFDVWQPVCGCDGNTYSNGCYAHRAGVSIDHDGECAVACFVNADCPAEQYCAKPLGQCDGPGECIDRLSDLVQCLAVWEPVCGCDGQTYSNGCYAQKAAVNIDYLDACDIDMAEDRIEAVPPRIDRHRVAQRRQAAF